MLILLCFFSEKVSSIISPSPIEKERPKMRKTAVFLLLMLALVACVGPAAKKAAEHEGVSSEQIQKCKTRSCFIGLGGDILLTKEKEDGTIVEVYRMKKQRGSSLRSFIHGVLSVATLGIWNVVGTPIEGYMSSEEYIVVRSFYDKDENATKVEIQGKVQ
jgi:hypothetical protein